MADKFLNVEIVTPQEKIFKGEAVSVSVPGALSPFEILFNHAPIVSSLDMGSIKITNTQNQEARFATASGFVEVNDNKVSILVENAVNSQDIDSDQLKIEIADLREKLRSSVDKGEIQQLKKLISEIENQLKLVN